MKSEKKKKVLEELKADKVIVAYCCCKGKSTPSTGNASYVC